MSKDHRYYTVKVLIESGIITEFNQIFLYIPKSVVARDLGTTPTRFSQKLARTELFSMNDLIQIARLIEVEILAILHVALAQYMTQRKRKSK